MTFFLKEIAGMLVRSLLAVPFYATAAMILMVLLLLDPVIPEPDEYFL